MLKIRFLIWRMKSRRRQRITLDSRFTKIFHHICGRFSSFTHKDVCSILISNLPSCHFYSQEEITHLITTVVDLQKRHKQVSDEYLWQFSIKPFNLCVWSASNFSLQYHPCIKNLSQENEKKWSPTDCCTFSWSAPQGMFREQYGEFTYCFYAVKGYMTIFKIFSVISDVGQLHLGPFFFFFSSVMLDF